MHTSKLTWYSCSKSQEHS